MKKTNDNESALYFVVMTENVRWGEGKYFCEVVDNLIRRQIKVFKNEMFWAAPGIQKSLEHPFTDQPEMWDRSEVELLGGEEITKQNFEDIWSKSLE